jgi:hypothetical protein
MPELRVRESNSATPKCKLVKKNSLAWVRERTITTERPPLVGEVSVNFCGYRVSRGQRDGSLRPYSRLSRPEPLLFLPSSSPIVLTRLSGPRKLITDINKICSHSIRLFSQRVRTFSEPSYSKMWSWITWGLEPRIAVLARPSSYLVFYLLK